MRCEVCGEELRQGQRYCGACGAPVRARMATDGPRRADAERRVGADFSDDFGRNRSSGGGAGFTLLICLLVLMAILSAGACYLLLTRGPDYTKWFSASTPTPTAIPAATDTPYASPTAAPPTQTPLLSPTASPTLAATPTATPTGKPTASAKPTGKPTATPKVTATPKPTATPGAAETFLEGLVLEGFSRRYAKEELELLSENELSVLRNGMYALSGLKFSKNQTLIDFFSRCDWYDPNETDAEKVAERFNGCQRDNVDAIVAVEKAKGYR